MTSTWHEFDGFVGAFKARDLTATWIAQQLPLIPILPIMFWLAHQQGRLAAMIVVFVVGLSAFQVTWLRHFPQQRHPPALHLKVIYSATVFTSAVVAHEAWLPALALAAMGIAMSVRSSDMASIVLFGVFVVAVILLLATFEQPIPMPGPLLFFALFSAYLLTVVAFDSTMITWEQRQLEDALRAAGGTAWDSDDTGTIIKVMGAPLRGVEPGTKLASIIHPDDVRPDQVIPGSVLEYRIPGKNGWRWLQESVGVRATSASSLRSGVSDITAAREAIKLTEKLARTDQLTGCPNRVAHVEFIEQWAAEDKAGHLLLVDLDRFKNINETLGHAVGDQVLKIISNRFCQIEMVAHVARLGGDEFGVAVSGNAAQARELAERVRDAGQESITIDDVLVSAGVSIGIASLDHGASADEVYRRASIALRAAKSPRGHIIVFDGHLEARDERHLALASRLPAALATGEIVAFHQPKIELATGRLIGTEALVRWQHPDEGLIMPGEFLDLVKVGGHYRTLTRTMLKAALADLARLQETQPELTVAVNINSRNLREYDFAKEVLALLEAADVRPEHLVLELTEDALVTGDFAVEKSLNELDAAGIRLSVDDFGTGFSSLSYLARLPVSEIKLDRSLISEIRSSPRDRVVVEAMLAMAYDLGLQVIAEGIEDIETLELLDTLGCWSGQGYHISRPVPFPELTANWKEPVPTA